MSGIFKAYDIRGSYPDELDEAMARKIGAAFIRYLNAGRIVAGRDMRLSSPSLAESFMEGAVMAGASVVDIGMTTTPMLYFAIGAGHFDGGVMVTASHLPAKINGFKLCREEAIPLSGDQGLPDIQRMVNENTPSEPPGHASGSIEEQSLMAPYIDHIAGFVHNPIPLKIVIDAGNGMAGPEIRRLFRRFTLWQLIPMYFIPDGHFPHHVANPLIASTTRDLQAVVLKENADIGVAFDGDADRCGFIDEKGERIPEDLVTALIAQFFLARHPGATILYDLRSSRVVPETIIRLGGKAVRCRVGHSFIKSHMRRDNALFAGELSGHYYFKDMGFTDNALFAMIQMFNLLSLKNAPISELIEPLGKYFKTGEINIQVKDKEKIFAFLQTHYRDGRQDHLDGLTIEYDAWWFNLRPSNTEPVVRLNLEATDRKAMEEKKRDVLDRIGESDPEMEIVR